MVGNIDTITLRADGKLFGRVRVDHKKQALLRKNQSLEIWKRLVQYVNANLKEKAEQQNFRALVQRCMAWCGLLAIPEDELVSGTTSLAMAANIKRGRKITIINRETFDLCQDVRGGLSAESGATRYQVDFELVLKWLVHHEPERGEKALRFLWDERESIGLSLGVCRNTDFTFYTQKIIEYPSIASPICKFILDRLDYYTEAEDKRRIIPLKACEICGKIMVFEKGSKKTCGNNCRVSKSRKGL